MSKGISLESSRLTLRVLDAPDGAKVLDFFLRNKDFLKEWETAREDSFYTLDYQAEQLAEELRRAEEGRLFKVWLFEKADRNFERVIGSIALNDIVRGCFHSCFLGYRLDKGVTNRGYMTEGVEQVLFYAFNELKLHRIEANIMPHNAASLRVVEKLGFYNEGLATKYLKINGRWEDHIHKVLRNHALE